MMIKEFEAKIAKRMLTILDLTELHLNIDIEALCDKARSPYGNVASICVYPQYLAKAKALLAGSSIKTSTVINFPSGDLNRFRACDEISQAIALGASEVDVVFPYHALLNRQAGMCLQFIEDVRAASEGIILKVILETGALDTLKWIRKASELSIRGGADFIKTSTGRYNINATLFATEIMLKVVKDMDDRVGVKVSGGINTFKEAQGYLELALGIMGSDWVTADHFRIGASKLYDSLMATIEGEDSSKITQSDSAIIISTTER